MTYGCHNRAPYKEHVVVEANRVWLTGDGGRVGTFNVTFPFRMSRDCQYTKTDLGRADAGCHGCKWRGADNNTPTT